MELVHQSKDELQKDFEDAKKGIDREKVDKVMKGIPFNGDTAPEIRALKSAWAKYHDTMRF